MNTFRTILILPALIALVSPSLSFAGKVKVIEYPCTLLLSKVMRVNEGQIDRIFDSPSGKIQVTGFIVGGGRITPGFPSDRKQRSARISIRLNGETVRTIGSDSLPSPDWYSNQRINQVVFSPDERYAFIASDNPNARFISGHSQYFAIYDSKTGTLKKLELELGLGSLTKRAAETYPFVFSADSKTIYLSGETGITEINASTGKVRDTIRRTDLGFESAIAKLHEEIEKDPEVYGDGSEYNYTWAQEKVDRTAFSPDRTRVMIQFADKSPMIYDLKKKEVTHTLPWKKSRHPEFVRFLDDETIVTLVEGELETFNLTTGKTESLYKPARGWAINDITVKADKMAIALKSPVRSGKYNQRFAVMKISTGKITEMTQDANLFYESLYSRFDAQDGVDPDANLYLTADGKKLVAVDGKSSLATIYNAETGKILSSIHAGDKSLGASLGDWAALSESDTLYIEAFFDYSDLSVRKIQL